VTTVATLTQRVRYRCDLAGNNVITDVEIRDYLSAAATWILREIVAQNNGTIYETSGSITVNTSGTSSLSAGPVLQVASVLWRRTGHDDVALRPTALRLQRVAAEWSEDDPPQWWSASDAGASGVALYVDRPPLTSQTLSVRYTPGAVGFSAGTDVNPIGCDDLIEIEAAIRCLHKEERPTQDLERERARLLGELRAAPRVDSGGPMQMPRPRLRRWSL
jgi:hypothetical protein